MSFRAGAIYFTFFPLVGHSSARSGTRARALEASFIAASRVRLGGSDAKRERKGERGADLIEARKRLHLGGGGKGLRAGIRVKSLPP